MKTKYAKRVAANLLALYDREEMADLLVESMARESAQGSELDVLRSRIAELEEGLAGIESCAFGYTGCRQTAEEAATWMNNEATRLLNKPYEEAEETA